MTGWERLGIGGLSQGYLSGRLSPSAVPDDAPAGIAAIDDDLSAFVAIDATHHASAPTPPVTRFRVLADSEPNPSQ
jgi:hypothetical protein